MRALTSVIGTTKDCSLCGERKPLAEFSPNRKMAGGIQSQCKPCRVVRNTESLNRNGRRGRVNAARKVAHRLNPVSSLLMQAKKRARSRGRPFSITVSDISIPDVCPVFGFPFQIGFGYGHDTSPSLDAIEPALGYVPGNVQVISNLANRMKNSASRTQLRMFAAWALSVTTEPING